MRARARGEGVTRVFPSKARPEGAGTKATGEPNANERERIERAAPRNRNRELPDERRGRLGRAPETLVRTSEEDTSGGLREVQVIFIKTPIGIFSTRHPNNSTAPGGIRYLEGTRRLGGPSRPVCLGRHLVFVRMVFRQSLRPSAVHTEFDLGVVLVDCATREAGERQAIRIA